MSTVTRFEHATFFGLTESQRPYNPGLYRKVKELLLNTPVSITESSGRRDVITNSHDLLIGIPPSAKSQEAFVLGAFGPLQAEHQIEIMTQLFEAASRKVGFDGTHLVLTFLEGRDDISRGEKEGETDAEPLLRLYTRLLATSSVDKPIKTVSVWDPHSPATVEALEAMYSDVRPDFGEVPVLSLTAVPLFTDYWKQLQKDGLPLVDDDSVVLSPDFGDLIKSVRAGEELNKPVYVTPKYRHAPNTSDPPNELYEVTTTDSIVVIRKVDWDVLKGKKVFTVDDIIDTGGTVAKLGEYLADSVGVKEFHFAATHGYFSQTHTITTAMEKGHISSLLTTDSLPTNKRIENAKTVSIAPAIALYMKAFVQPLEPEEKIYLQRLIFDPGPFKEQIIQSITSGIIPRYRDSDNKVKAYWEQLGVL